jgi:hypothetical protein
MDHLPLPSCSDSEIEPRVKLAPCAFAPFFATESLHRNQASTEEGLLVEKFGKPRSGKPLRSGELTTVSHRTTSLLSDILHYIRNKAKVNSFLKCEFALGNALALTD